jgi:hypothetical protein
MAIEEGARPLYRLPHESMVEGRIKRLDFMLMAQLIGRAS